MSKLPYFACATALLLLGAKQQNQMFAKYKSVEAYEIRSGVLAMPRYAEDGQICEIGVERRAYSPGMIRINQSFSQKEIDQIVDELAPPDQRGREYKGILGDGGLMQGNSYTGGVVYENVTVLAYGGITNSQNASHFSITGDVVFTIRWTKRKCQ
jgi:hypothetical protein